ncbi:CaiB/BaiF CoA transferase family protein [Caldiplasma sukawensis]
MRIIEIGHIVAGPTAGLILSELGHEVIKIEKPGTGDIARSLTGTSKGTFPFFNTNKKSITLDLSNENGRDIFLELLKTSDVLIDNLGHGSLEKLGLSYEILKEANRKLIYLKIEGYGEGPLESRKSLDYPIEVHSGVAYMNGLNGRPMRLGASIIDMNAAMFGVIGVMNAIIEREKTGEGKRIVVGLFETSLFLMGQHINTYGITGEDLKPINEMGFAWGIYDFFSTKDEKRVFIAVTTDAQWNKFRKAMSLNLDDEQKYETNRKRYEHRDELIKIVQDAVIKMNLIELSEILDRENIVFSVMKKPWEAIEEEQMMGKYFLQNFEGKKLKTPAIPIGGKFLCNPPSLGEHTTGLLKSMGFSAEKIQKLKEQNII